MAGKRNDLSKFQSDADDSVKSMYKIFSKLHHPFIMPSDSKWLPAVDVFETDEELIIILDVACVDPKEIDLFIKRGHLVIRGIRNEISKDKKRHYHKMEIDYGPFERQIDIPIAVDPDNIRTKYHDGFLEIKLQKVPDRRKSDRTIRIEWEDQ
ncbi:Hsp20/alpha crystallin family protein [candidate division KSB1 bacterium]